jgi:hypothetical protein
VWHRLLRDHDPIHLNSDGTVLLTRYDDVRGVWRHKMVSVDKEPAFRARFGPGPLLEHHTTAMLFRDPPDHDRLREVVSPFFVPSSIERFRRRVEQLVARLLDEAEERGTFDFVSDFAARIPVELITEISGLPREDGYLLRDWGRQLLFPLNPAVPEEAVSRGHDAASEFGAYVLEHVNRIRRVGVTGDPASVLEALVAAEGDGGRGRVSESEIVHMCMFVFNGGHETTTNLIAAGAHALLQHPDQYEALRAHPRELAGTAAEECARYVSPLQLQGRRALQDIEVPSGVLQAGTEVVLCQAAANRDERQFARPDVLDLRRRPNSHVAFGLGPHACVGRALARLEASIVLPRVAQRFPGLRHVGEVTWNANVRFRGLQSFPVSAS